jgi:hypothetical protein
VKPSKSLWESITGGNWELDLDKVPAFAPLHDPKFHKPVTTTDNKTVPYINDIIPASAGDDKPLGMSLQDTIRREQALGQQWNTSQYQQNLISEQMRVADQQRRLNEVFRRQEERIERMRNEEMLRRQQQDTHRHTSAMNAALLAGGPFSRTPRVYSVDDETYEKPKPVSKAKPKKVERYEEPKRTLDLDHLD